MRIAPRLARPTAVAAVAAAALALPASPASAMTREECLALRMETAMRFLGHAEEFREQGDYWSYWNSAVYAMGYLKYC